jgi:methyl-accepting chemotaxis protein
MFLQNEENNNSSGNVAKELEGLASATGVLDFSIKNFQQTLANNLPLGPHGLKNITNATSKLEELTFKLTTETLGQTRAVGEGIRDTMARAAYESAQYGITLTDQISVFKSINEVMQRNTVLTSEQQTNMALLARNAGVAAGDIATMVEAFDTIGVGTTDAMNNISNMQKEARSYGINVGQFMKNIGSNVKLLNSYNFKNGVEGFTLKDLQRWLQRHRLYV